jgi:hypothetical protein
MEDHRMAIDCHNTPGLPGETPVMQQYRAWETYSAWLNAEAAGMPGAEWEAALAKKSEIEEAILATPSEGAEDVIAKFAAYSNFGVFGVDDQLPLWEEVRKLIGGAA